MKKNIFSIVFILIAINLSAQDTFSKIIVLQEELPRSLGTHFQLLNDELLVFSSQFCLDDNQELINCFGISRIDFNGEVKDFRSINNFDLTLGTKSIIDNDTIYIMVDDSVEGRNKINLLKLTLNSIDFNQLDFRFDLDKRYVSSGMIMFDNNIYGYGYFADLIDFVNVGFVQKWSNGFEEDLGQWNFERDMRIRIGDIRPTLDSNLIMILDKTRAGPYGGPPLHLIKIDTLGNTLKEIEMDCRGNLVFNLEVSSEDALYFGCPESTFTTITKMSTDLDTTYWELEFPTSNALGPNQKYEITEIIESKNGDILIGGRVNYIHLDQERVISSYVARISRDGKILWFKILTHSNPVSNVFSTNFSDSYLAEIKELPDGRIVGIGSVWQDLEAGALSQELWMIIIDENGCIENFDCEDDVYILDTGESFLLSTNVSNLPVLGEKKFYPNPVQDVLHTSLEKEFEYSIQNIQGQKVLSGNAISEIDVSDLPDGIYFIQIQDKDNLYQAQKFVKL